MKESIAYYDKAGNPLSFDGYLQVCTDPDYKRVAFTKLPNDIEISTVWLGLDHQYGDGPPIIFETMAFGLGREEEDIDRYSTEAEAIAGHERMIQKYKEPTP